VLINPKLLPAPQEYIIMQYKLRLLYVFVSWKAVRHFVAHSQTKTMHIDILSVHCQSVIERLLVYLVEEYIIVSQKKAILSLKSLCNEFQCFLKSTISWQIFPE
jgi:hypothetical protein